MIGSGEKLSATETREGDFGHGGGGVQFESGMAPQAARIWALDGKDFGGVKA
jgi:hypothetical protein